RTAGRSRKRAMQAERRRDSSRFSEPGFDASRVEYAEPARPWPKRAQILPPQTTHGEASRSSHRAVRSAYALSDPGALRRTASAGAERRLVSREGIDPSTRRLRAASRHRKTRKD